VCEYCGCRDIPLIGRLSEEHYEAVDALGALRRAIDGGAEAEVRAALGGLAADLFPHNDSEEAGLFRELAKDEYFAPTVEELIAQHRQFRALVGRIEAGDWHAYHELEHTLRHHIDREENGLFPATAVAVDGATWAEIDRLTHDFNHAHDREHGHSEAELVAARRATATTADQATPATQATAGIPGGDEAFRLRRATAADAAELLALWRQCGLRVRSPETVAEELEAVLGLHPDLVQVAVSGDSIVGSVLGTFDGRRGWVSRLATRPDRRAEGIGSALLQAVEDGVRALGGRRVNLLIDAEDYPLVDYYGAHGYAAEDLIFLAKEL